MPKIEAILILMILIGGVGAMTMFSGCIDPGDSPTGKVVHTGYEPTPKPEPTSIPESTPAPQPTQEPTPTPEPKPVEIKDTDGDGVPDHKDYDPRKYIGPEEDLNRDGALDASKSTYVYDEDVEYELNKRNLLDGLQKFFPGGIKTMEIIKYDTDFDLSEGGNWDKVEIRINGEHFASFKYHPGLDIYGCIGGVVDPEGYYGAADLRIN